MKSNLNKLMGAGLMTALILTGCSNRPTNQYTISGHIEGLPDSAIIQFTPVSHEPEKPIAEAIAVNGKFKLTDTIAEPIAVYMKVKDYYGGKPLMIENTDIRIQGKVTSNEDNSYYNMNELTVTGSPLTEHYHQLLSARNVLDSIHSADQERFKDIRSLIGKARVEKNKALMDSIIGTEEYKASAVADKEFFKTVEETYHKIFMDNKETFWGPLMLISFTTYLSPDQKQVYEAFSQEAKDSYYGKKVKEELYPAGKEGSQVPNFTLKGEDGKEVSLSDIYKDKKYVLIDFWASWCNPCRKEIPNLKQLYKQYADKGFQIISISIDKKKADWEKALKEEQLSWLNFIDNNEVSLLYKVKAVPTMYLIDNQGILVGENLRGEALATKLRELFE